MRATWLVATALLTATSTNVWAAAGSFDPTFGLGGRVLTELGGYAFAQQVVRQTDGKIVAAGFAGTYASGPRDLVLARYTADGSLDASFGTDGIVRTVVRSYPQADALLLQPDGGLVLATTNALHDVTLIRYLTDGSLDPAFGSGGIVEIPLGAAAEPVAAVLQPDGKIVVAADTSMGGPASGLSDLRVLRVTGDGGLDAGFGTAGVATIDFGGHRDDAADLVLQPDGRIVVSGYFWNDPDTLRDGTSLSLARLNDDGTLDGTFGTGGTFTHTFGRYDRASALVRQADGSLLLGGTSNVLDPVEDWLVIRSDPFLLRLDAGGALDAAFGTGGVLWLDERVDPETMLLAPDGKIVLVDTVGAASFKLALGIARLDANASPDLGFANAGAVVAALSASDAAGLSGLVEPDGNIVVAGYDTEPCPPLVGYQGRCYHFGLARFLGVVAPCATDADCRACERCGPAGACSFGPRTACTGARPIGAQLVIDTPYQRPEKHGVRLTWRGSTPLGFDPVTTDEVGLCLYLEGDRQFAAVAPAAGSCNGKPCWTGTPSVGFRYLDPEQKSDGMRKIRFSPSRITVEARGENVLTTMHGLPYPAVVEQGYGRILVQVHAGGSCAQADMADMKTVFKRVRPNTWTWTRLVAKGQ